MSLISALVNDGKFVTWSTQTLLPQYNPPTAVLDGPISYSPCESRLLTGRGLWNAHSLEKINLEYPEPRGDLENVTFSPDGKLWIDFSRQEYLHQAKTETRIYDISSGKTLGILDHWFKGKKVFSDDNSIFCYAWKENGHLGILHFVDTTTLTVFLSIPGTLFTPLSFSPDNSTIAVHAVGGYGVVLYNWKLMCHISLNGGHRHSVHTAIFSHDGAQITTACSKEIRIWNASTGECLSVYHGVGDTSTLGLYPYSPGMFPVSLKNEFRLIDKPTGEAKYFAPGLWAKFITHPSESLYCGIDSLHFNAWREERLEPYFHPFDCYKNVLSNTCKYTQEVPETMPSPASSSKASGFSLTMASLGWDDSFERHGIKRMLQDQVGRFQKSVGANHLSTRQAVRNLAEYCYNLGLVKLARSELDSTLQNFAEALQYGEEAQDDDLIKRCRAELDKLEAHLEGLEAETNTAPPHPLTKLGKYEIRRELGKGANGTAYEGFDPVSERTVAIKTVLLSDSEILKNFRREARAAGRLSHPNIVTFYEHGENLGLAYNVWEFICGKELKAYFDEQQRFQIKDVVSIMSQLLKALDNCHNRGVIHRDIKPANIIITSEGFVKIHDFGVASIGSDSGFEDGQIVGTPTYMSPEQVMGLAVDQRTDIYSAGVVLYIFLTGERPFTGSVVEIMQKALKQEATTPSELNPSISKALDNVVKKAMAKRTEDRFQTALEFEKALKDAG